MIEFIYLNIAFKNFTPLYTISENIENILLFFNIFFALLIVCICTFYFYKNSNSLLAALEKKSSEVEKALRAKSDFLANMSHEIRTPMNAIMGMSELMLDEEEMSARVYEKVRVINSASTTLLALINDILDFSKIDSGNMEIINCKYELASLLNDAVIIVDTKIDEKPIELIVNINPDIPSNLIGDEIRLKQILINVLGNSAKFTHNGCISLNVDFKYCDKDKIILKFEITDTGIGIKKEDLGKIFGEFQQVDTRKNRNTKGTGLGLAITKKLTENMDGEIFVTSDYGKGTKVSINIPQIVAEKESIVEIKNAEKFKILVYDSRHFITDSVSDSMSKMGIYVSRCYDLETFKKCMNEINRFTHIFYDYKSGFNEVKGYSKIYPNIIFVMMEARNEFVDKKIFYNEVILKRPIFITSIANILNNNENTVVEENKKISKKIFSFKAPNANVLVVDDNVVNLKVIEGFLLQYMVNVTTVTSGEEAINLIIKNKNYDLIFMDHMMPVMDGIDTTKFIRKIDNEYCKNVPIVALTANAIVGIKEVFLDVGMNDFLSKPIESIRLYNVMQRWIPEDKKVKLTDNGIMDLKNCELLSAADKIKELDVRLGMQYCGGTAEGYISILKSYAITTEGILTEMISAYKNNMISDFVVRVHGIKSSSKSIGATNIGELAAELEKAGNENNIEFIDENIYILAGLVNTIIVKIKKAYPISMSNNQNGTVTVEKDELAQMFANLKKAIHEIDNDKIDNLLSEIKNIKLDKKNADILIRISEYIQNFDYEKAETLI